MKYTTYNVQQLNRKGKPWQARAKYKDVYGKWKDLLTIVEQLTSKGVDFVSLKECIDTATPQGKFMLTVFGAMAELERENILERQREGIAIAKEQGLYQGRQKMKIDREQFEAVVKEWRADKITAVEAMKRLDVKPNTFYRRVKEWGL